MSKVLNVHIVTVFGEYQNPEDVSLEERLDEYCYDYYGVRIFLDGKLYVSYGDYYHTKGRERAQGFLDALTLLAGEPGIPFTEVSVRAEDALNCDPVAINDIWSDEHIRALKETLKETKNNNDD